ncbi:MAG: hypothetical protein R3C14_35590 [Caldilineaceae bacterium]
MSHQGGSGTLGANPDPQRHQHNRNLLWILILLAITVSGLLTYVPRLTGNVLLDGAIGLALGLYICVHPAANGVKMLFFERVLLRHLTTERSVVRWLGLNLLVLLLCWQVVFLSIARLMDRT